MTGSGRDAHALGRERAQRTCPDGKVVAGMPVQKKIPMRQCLGCREMRPKREMMRVVRSPEGEVHLDLRGKANGRGAYVCTDPECLKKAVRSRALERALSAQIPEEVYQSLREEMERGV